MRSYEASVHGRLSVGALCNYLQEAAGAHAAELGFGTEYFSSFGQSWVLHRIRVSLSERPSWPEEVTVYTWPSGSEAVRATREFTVSGSSCGEFARATSVWLLMDVKRRRPARLPPLVRQLQPLNTVRAVDVDKPPAPPDTTSIVDQRPVYHSDLDANGHVNNVRIVTWIVDSARPGPASEAREIDIVFRKEVLPGRVVRIVTGNAGGSRNHFRHLLSTAEDGVLTVAESVWSQSSEDGDPEAVP